MRGRRTDAKGILAVIAVAAIAEGCSFATVQGPPPASQRQPGYYCTSSVIMPVIDFTLSMVSLFTAIAALNSPNADHGDATNSHLLIGGGVLVGGLAFTSGVVGLARTSDCDQARAEDARRPTLHLERRPASPGDEAAGAAAGQAAGEAAGKAAASASQR
jgi:hypothetical protein